MVVTRAFLPAASRREPTTSTRPLPTPCLRNVDPSGRADDASPPTTLPHTSQVINASSRRASTVRRPADNVWSPFTETDSLAMQTAAATAATCRHHRLFGCSRRISRTCLAACPDRQLHNQKNNGKAGRCNADQNVMRKPTAAKAGRLAPARTARQTGTAVLLAAANCVAMLVTVYHQTK